MNDELNRFINYLKSDRKMSDNTLVSYKRDISQLINWLDRQGLNNYNKITTTVLNSYILSLESEGKATSTISRVIASIKAFFSYEYKNGRIVNDCAAKLKAPRVEKKVPVILTYEEVDRFLAQPAGKDPKTLRDRAMLELIYATGIRVSELINLECANVNLSAGFISCKTSGSIRAVPFGKTAKNALQEYLNNGRKQLLKNQITDKLFINCSGKPISRQGLWKIIKYYGEKADIQADITPQALRHSFAVHLLRNGANMEAVNKMLGHRDISTTNAYINYIQNPSVRETYAISHPRP